MSAGPTDQNGQGDDNLLVAEFVLGVLDAQEHERMAARIVTNPALQAEVRFWQSRLSSLDENFEEVTAPAGTFSKIEQRLFGAPAKPSPFVAMWNNLAVWRGFAAGGIAVAALAIGFSMMRPTPQIPDVAVQYVATLEAEDSEAKFLAVYDSATGNVRLAGLAGEVVPDRDYELWFIEGEAPAVSLGVIPVDARSEVALTEEMRALIQPGTVFAVTLEPKGGAPEGVATGPIVALGAVSLV